MNLIIDSINKSFTNNKETQNVLKDISIKVNGGEFVTLLGPSGCGKTTLLTIVAGFKKADSGDIILNSEFVNKPGPDRGFVFQSYALFPWMSVKDNILYPMKMQKVAKDIQKTRLKELLELAQLEGKEKLFPHQISGGMKQRTAVVRALACKPEVLLMDEPLGAIDFHMRKSLQEELEQIWLKDKTTVLMVTHDVDEAVYLSDRVIVMSRNKGEIVGDISIDSERPRDRSSNEYAIFKDELTNLLTEAANCNPDSNEDIG